MGPLPFISGAITSYKWPYKWVNWCEITLLIPWAPKPTFLEVFMVYNLVFRWPKPLFFMVWGAHGKGYNSIYNWLEAHLVVNVVSSKLASKQGEQLKNSTLPFFPTSFLRQPTIPKCCQMLHVWKQTKKQSTKWRTHTHNSINKNY